MADIAPLDQDLLTSTSHSTSEWKSTIAKVIRSVNKNEATGFVVDKDRGYILTNRHVVSTGPFWGHCTFSNHEECDVEVAYYDPVHDFAFLRFDPSAIRHTDVVALELRPEAAQVGVEVKVIGNDAGEVLSIASAVLSRLDRNPPEYSGHYQDCNTNYIQAAAASKGGSSGSPVVDIHGYAVALQAGGKASAATTNFFLPLQRVARALNLLQNEQPIPRGTLQAQWRLESFDICRRLGLTHAQEQALRGESEETNTMLVVNSVLPKGPADGILQQSDIVLKVQGKIVRSFAILEDIIDSRVGDSVKLEVQRGGETCVVEVTIQDLYSITPSKMIRVGDVTFNPLSYTIARYFAIPCQGVYCPHRSLMFDLATDSLIDSVNDLPTPDLQTLEDVILQLDKVENVKISYRKLVNLHVKLTAFVSLWVEDYPKLEVWSQAADYRRWNIETKDYKTQETSIKADPGSFPDINGLSNTKTAYIARSIAKVAWYTSRYVDAVTGTNYTGHGLIVDATRGLVLVSRAIVRHSNGKVKLEIANVEVPAQVEFLHPLHGYVVLKYEPKAIDAPIESIKFSTVPAKLNANGHLICVNRNAWNLTITQTTITDVQAISVDGSLDAPVYRPVNFDAVSVESPLASRYPLGLFVDMDGLVTAITTTYLEGSSSDDDDVQVCGLQASIILPVLERLKQGTLTKARIIPAEFGELSIATARKYGVKDTWLQQITEQHSRHRVFIVSRLMIPPKNGHNHIQDHLKDNDILLALNNNLIMDIADLGTFYDESSLTATIFRSGQEMTIEIPTMSIENLETQKSVDLCGATFHKPHLAMRQMMGELPSEIFASVVFMGTPAGMSGLSPTNFVTHVNDIETPDLDTLLRVVTEIPDNAWFRLRTVSTLLIRNTVTIRKYEYYFPTEVHGSKGRLL